MDASTVGRLATAALVIALPAAALHVGTPFGLEIAAGIAGGVYLGYTGTRYNSPLFDGAVAGALGAVLYGVLSLGALAVTGGTPRQYVVLGTFATVPFFAAEAIVVASVVRRRRDRG